MIARMLSVIARQGSCLLAAFSLSTAAEFGLAETEIEVSTPATVVENPFATGAPPADVVAEEPELPRRGPTTYQNPFATMSSAPPIEIPARPGPVSRWRRQFEPLDDTSPVKAAILSADPFELPQVPWNELPTTETLHERVAASRTRTDSPAAGHFGDPPDPMHFAGQSLHQPSWLAPSRGAVRPLPPIGQAENAEQPAYDPFDVPGSSLGGPQLGAAAPLSQTALQWGPGSPDTSAVIISDFAQSADDMSRPSTGIGANGGIRRRAVGNCESLPARPCRGSPQRDRFRTAAAGRVGAQSSRRVVGRPTPAIRSHQGFPSSNFFGSAMLARNPQSGRHIGTAKRARGGVA